MKTVLIGGQQRPFHIGANQGDIFCRLQGLTLRQYATTLADLENLGFGTTRDFIYSALKAAADKAGREVDFTNLMVGDWMDAPDYDAVEVLAPIISALGDQFAAKAAYQAERDLKNAEALTAGPAAEKTTA